MSRSAPRRRGADQWREGIALIDCAGCASEMGLASLLTGSSVGTWNIDTVDGVFQNVLILIPLCAPDTLTPATPAAPDPPYPPPLQESAALQESLAEGAVAGSAFAGMRHIPTPALVTESLARIRRTLDPEQAGQMHVIVACMVRAEDRYRATFPARSRGRFHHHARILMARGWPAALRRNDGDPVPALADVSAEVRHLMAETPGSPAQPISRVIPDVDEWGGTFLPLAQALSTGPSPTRWNGLDALEVAVRTRFTS